MRRLIRKIIDIKVHLDIGSSDLVLCEYPKSGVTYLSFLLSNYLLAVEQKDVSVNFFNINKYVQDLHRTPSIEKSFQFKSVGFRILKSHASYSYLKYPQKIVLIRNPVNTLRSYHRHVQVSSNKDFPDFNTFVRSPKFGIDAWLSFYSMHLSDTNPLGLTLFCYEDNVQNPSEALQIFCNLIGIKYCPQSADIACTKSSIESMKLSEDQSSRLGLVNRKLRFVGATRSLTESSSTLDPTDYIYDKFIKSELPKLISPAILKKICPVS